MGQIANKGFLAALAVLSATSTTPAQSGDDPARVTVENYTRAESDASLTAVVKEGAFGKFVNIREPQPIDKQNVIRPNRRAAT